MSIVQEVVADLTAESVQLDDLVSGIDVDAWATMTPAVGWTIAHQIAHLGWTDRVAAMSATDPEGFAGIAAAAIQNPMGFVDAAAEEGAALAPEQILAQWRASRTALAQALVAVPDGTKIAWFGPPMSATSMATARLMETWAHGLDIADALGVVLPLTDRIKGVVHIGVRTRDFAYLVNAKPAPAEPFRYEITAPSGELWTWGPADAADVVRASAADFCALVTQRRAPADLNLDVTGDAAREWVTIAQCFAGPPGKGRPPSGGGKSVETQSTRAMEAQR